MKKILVTTDFSDKSKAALLFAIQLNAQSAFDLTFFHVHTILTPTAWNFTRIDEYEAAQIKIIEDKLHVFVEDVYKSLILTKSHKKCVIKSSVFPQSCIMEYAVENKFDFICISTRGAGKIQRLLGTNTANLINHSEVPIIAVPYKYKTATIKSILYASDLTNLEKELKKVITFSGPLKATIELLHFTTPLETITDAKIVEAAIKKLTKFEIKVSIKHTDFVKSMVANLETSIQKTRPSMLIMFTEQNRNLFQKIFLSSKSAEYSFESKVPLLVFNKT
jgi:nucleotide-binding universal stress UspA family protein